MSGTGPSRRRRIAGERSTSAPEAVPTTRPRTAPVRPARPARPSARSTAPAPRRDPSGTRRPSTAKTPRDERERRPRGGRRPLRGLLTAPRHERRRLLPLVVLAVACLIVGLVLAGRGGWQVWQQSRVDGAREAAAGAAGTAIETMYTYDSRNLDDARDAERLMTPSFRSEYGRIIDTLGQLGDQRQISIESTARDTAAMPCGEECSATRQRVMVFFDLSRTTADGTVPDVFGNRVALTMVERDGRWLVGDIQVL